MLELVRNTFKDLVEINCEFIKPKDGFSSEAEKFRRWSAWESSRGNDIPVILLDFDDWMSYLNPFAFVFYICFMFFSFFVHLECFTLLFPKCLNGRFYSREAIDFYPVLRQKRSPDVFYKKGVLKNFAKFTRKHQCHSLFLIKVACLSLAHVFSGEYFSKNFKNSFFYKTPLDDCLWK